MIKMTGRAIAEIKKQTRTPGEKPGGVLRLVAGPFGRLQFVTDYDQDFSCDQVITDDGKAILLVDRELSSSLEGITIDYQPGRGGLFLVRDKGQADA